MTSLLLVASLKNGFAMLYAIGKIFGAEKNKACMTIKYIN